MSLVRVVVICLASTHTALVSSPSLAVLHLSTYLPTDVSVLDPALAWGVRFIYYWARDCHNHCEGRDFLLVF